jgi:hypothetical protein
MKDAKRADSLSYRVAMRRNCFVRAKGTVNLADFVDDDLYCTAAQKPVEGVWATLVNSRHATNRAARSLR